MSKSPFLASLLVAFSKLGITAEDASVKANKFIRTINPQRKKKSNRLASGNRGHEDPHTKMRRDMANRSNAMNRKRIKRWKY